MAAVAESDAWSSSSDTDGDSDTSSVAPDAATLALPSETDTTATPSKEDPFQFPQLKQHKWTYGHLVVQAPSPAPVRAADPLILVLDASTSNKKLDLTVLGEALTRLLVYLSKIGRRVSILAFHSEVIVLHPCEDRMFPLMSCSLESAAPLKVNETMRADVAELHTALNLPIKEGNVEFIVKAYLNMVRSGGDRVVNHTWITSTLRLAAMVLRYVGTRTEHSQVLLMCDGGEYYGRDKAGKQGFLEAPDIVKKLVPAFSTLPCTVSISCLAIGADAELDTLASIAYTFDGLLAYAAGAKDVGNALVSLCRFLARRPTQLLSVTPGAVVQQQWPLPAVCEARTAYATARAVQLLGEDADGAQWLGVTPSGYLGWFNDMLPETPRLVQYGPHGTNEEADDETMPDLVPIASDVDSPPLVIVNASIVGVADAVVALLYPLMSWRTTAVAAADTPALTAALEEKLRMARLVPQSLLAPVRQLVQARTGQGQEQDKSQAKVLARTAFVRMLQLAYHPFLAQVDVLPAHVPMLDALPLDSSVIEARADFEREHARWAAAAQRAARYTCSFLHDAREMLGVCATKVDGTLPVLWAPHKALADVQGSEGSEDTSIMLGPALQLSNNLLGLQAHEAATSGVWEAADISLEEDGNYVAAGQVVSKESRVARDLQAVLAARASTCDLTNLAVPLFLQLDDAMNPYTSMAASKKLATIVRGTDDVWQDPMLATCVYGGLVGRWLEAACSDDGVRNLPAPADMQLVADVVRSLAITAETRLVSDMYARFVKGIPSKEEVAAAEVAAEAAESDEDIARTTAVLERYASKTAWRTTNVAGHLPALGAILALYRNPQEHARAKQAAITEYVDTKITEKKKAEAASFDAEVQRRLDETLKARRVHKSAVPSAKEVRSYQKTIRRALKAERGGADVDADAEATEGAKLDDAEKKAALAKEIIEAMPPDLHVETHLKMDKYKVAGFASDVVPAIVTEASRRGESDKCVAALSAKLVQLHDLCDSLVHTVPANNTLLAQLRLVFGGN